MLPRMFAPRAAESVPVVMQNAKKFDKSGL
jgi:hypothetical protein